jgi:hypothetical protein
MTLQASPRCPKGSVSLAHEQNTWRDKKKWTLIGKAKQSLPESMAAVEPVGLPKVQKMKNHCGRWQFPVDAA